MTTFEVLPVFSSVVSATKVKEDLSELWDVTNTLEFFRTTAEDTHLVYSSKDMHILNSLPQMRKIMLDYFYEFKNTVLKLETTDFEITTSWVTKTEPSGFCQYHKHKNSYYSAVLYSNKTNSADSGNLLFSDDGIKNESISVNNPSEWNILNSKQIVIEPDKNLLVFFPSFLRHRISKYTGSTDRLSLAFNLYPVGQIGNGDSSLTVTAY